MTTGKNITKSIQKDLIVRISNCIQKRILTILLKVKEIQIRMTVF